MFIDAQSGLIHNDGSAVLNGAGVGDVGQAFQGVRFEPGYQRPYIDRSGRRVVSAPTGRMVFNNQTKQHEPEIKVIPVEKLIQNGMYSPVYNATAFRRDDWAQIDRAVITSTRQRLRAWSDLVASSSVGGFNAMGRLTYEYSAMSDVGEAIMDMDAIVEGRNNQPLFKTRSVPLPITHSDFFFSQRQLAVARNTGTPLDTTMAEMAGRRVAEMIERTTLGLEGSLEFGTRTAGYDAHDGLSKIYGYTNSPARVTKTDLTAPTGSNPEAVKQDVIEMRETMYANGFFGPFMLYHSTGYDAFLDDDYYRSGGTSANRTLRERIEEIDNIRGIRRLDYLTSGYQMIMVQMTSDVARAINGMDITTVQWESQGGARINFKVMAIQVPLIASPYNGVAGIIHATTS